MGTSKFQNSSTAFLVSSILLYTAFDFADLAKYIAAWNNANSASGNQTFCTASKA
ncbi:MAG: hypothetical protein BWY04_00964 [candidate division CPR1 bacterium ADurb.Bin160]|jgi:hypothetical protein|uniref:Uncharacterized protein n=1 Tax=candidate division CPR1 bacterium ADurb.Bin160 TaxID=1852826 RepID=A0A1V5ZMC7_9BACT|nr:MAG: hypothetical protein BWY04_00964 [candidate division CPR1 bacterium ADurb.Bin160]